MKMLLLTWLELRLTLTNNFNTHNTYYVYRTPKIQGVHCKQKHPSMK